MLEEMQARYSFCIKNALQDIPHKQVEIDPNLDSFPGLKT